MITRFSSSLLLPLFASVALASSANQCRGSCHIVQNGLVNQAPSSIRIDGPSHMVSDLSQAAGWEIFDCPSDWDKGSVDVRLVCTDDDPEAKCHHVLEDGAENTIVRLPESCGVGPVARVARWEVALDQRVPRGSVAEQKLHRRGLTPSVVSARFDYDFGAIPATRGTVTFDITAAHHPDVRDAITHPSHVQRALREAATITSAAAGGPSATPTRTNTNVPAHTTTDAPGATDDFLGINFSTILGDISTAIGDVSTKVGNEISTGIHEISTGIADVSTKITDGVSTAIGEVSTGIADASTKIGNEITSIGDHASTIWNEISTGAGDIVTKIETIDWTGDLSQGYEKSKGFTAVNTNANITLVDESMGCTLGHYAFDQSANINVDADVHINAAYAFKIKGKLVPPALDDFAIAGAMSGKFNATFNIDMYLSADLLLPAVQLIGVGIPGLSVPGIITLGPEVAIKAQVDLAVDVAFAASVPVAYDFERIDFVFPPSLANGGSEAIASKKTSDFELNVSPGDQTGSFGLHIIPKLEFGADILNGLVSAEVYLGLDMDATFDSNGTIYTDYSYDGCQQLSIGAVAKAGVSAGALKFFNVGDYIPLWDKRETLWSHCSNDTDGPSTAIYDNGDGTYTNASGDLVNENGQLIDANGTVIADADAADADPTPIKNENGTEIPEEDLILDNLDGTFEDAWGNLTNSVGQRISWNGTILGCELDTTNMTDADGNPLNASDAIFEADDGSFSNSLCQLVNEEGSLVDQDGNTIDYEDFIDAATNATIDAADVVIDNEDGTYSDPWGNPVDMWGGAIDVDDDGNVVNVTLTPDTDDDDGAQEDADPEVATDPLFTILPTDELETIALNLIHGSAAANSDTATGASTTEVASSTTAPSSSETESSSTVDTSSTTSVGTTSADSTSVGSTSSESVSTSADSTTIQPSSSTDSSSSSAPSATGATCNAKKRSVSPPPISKRSSPPQVKRSVPTTHRQKRTLLGKRSGFGCTFPSISGLPLPSLTNFEDLARLF